MLYVHVYIMSVSAKTAHSRPTLCDIIGYSHNHGFCYNALHVRYWILITLVTTPTYWWHVCTRSSFTLIKYGCWLLFSWLDCTQQVIVVYWTCFRLFCEWYTIKPVPYSSNNHATGNSIQKRHWIAVEEEILMKMVFVLYWQEHMPSECTYTISGRSFKHNNCLMY